MLRTALIALIPIAASACHTRPPLLTDEALVLELPLVRQDELWECGLVSITALARYYGIAVPRDTRLALAGVAVENEGLSGGELRAALEQLGLEVYVFRGSLEDGPEGLYGHVDRGRPPIVMLSRDGSLHHYCLVLGYDPPRGHIVLLDPRRGRVILPEEVFERSWERSNRFTLVAVPLENEPSAQHAGAARNAKE